MKNQNEPKYTTQFNSNNRGCEIHSESSAPSVFVYRPKRDRFQSKEEFKLTPGYISASNFHIRDAQDARDFEATMSEAIRLLNEYNSVVESWEPIVDHWKQTRWLQDRVTELESEEGAKRTLARIKQAKKSAVA